jgi:hypothetical protein
MSNLGGLILLVYFLYRGFVLAAARLARRADSDTSELSKHRQRDTDRAARQEQSLAAEHERLLADHAALQARHEALHERRAAELRQLLDAGGSGDANEYAERALAALLGYQEKQRERDARLVDEVEARFLRALDERVRAAARLRAEQRTDEPDEPGRPQLPPPGSQ